VTMEARLKENQIRQLLMIFGVCGTNEGVDHDLPYFDLFVRRLS